MTGGRSVAVPANRLDRGFSSGGPGLICYLPLGDPALPADAADRYVEAGVDVLEIGIPVANPYIDGTIVRSSMRRAREAGMTIERAVGETARLRERHPGQAMVWMSYGTVMEEDELVRAAASAGVDGVLFPEPARHFARLSAKLLDRGIHLLHFLARDAPDVDVEAARGAGGYVMLQAIDGITGAGDADAPLPDSRRQIARLRAAGVTAPVALGIGISTPEQVREAVDMGADAVIVGSAVLEAALAGAGDPRAFLRALRAAVR